MIYEERGLSYMKTKIRRILAMAIAMLIVASTSTQTWAMDAVDEEAHDEQGACLHEELVD